MAWNGTVTCSECYNTGHNRSGCPKRKERYKEALALPEEEREYYHRSIIREVENKKQRSTTRKCSYCDTQGHNRRKCEKLIEHMDVVIRMQKSFRTNLLDHFNNIGMNLGALVIPEGEYVNDDQKVPMMVTDINWKYCNVMQGELTRMIVAVPLRSFNNDRSRSQYTIQGDPEWPTGPRWSHDQSYSLRSYGVQVVAAGPGDVVPPSGWLDDTQGIKEWFKDRATWQWTREGDEYNSSFWWKLEEDFEENQELKKTA